MKIVTIPTIACSKLRILDRHAEQAGPTIHWKGALAAFMHSLKRSIAISAAALAFATGGTIARAEESPPSPSPAETAKPTFMDRQYDGKLHAMVAPYIWGPSVKLDTEFT